jgi:hypothetical protein
MFDFVSEPRRLATENSVGSSGGEDRTDERNDEVTVSLGLVDEPTDDIIKGFPDRAGAIVNGFPDAWWKRAEFAHELASDRGGGVDSLIQLIIDPRFD